MIQRMSTPMDADVDGPCSLHCREGRMARISQKIFDPRRPERTAKHLVYLVSLLHARMAISAVLLGGSFSSRIQTESEIATRRFCCLSHDAHCSTWNM